MKKPICLMLVFSLVSLPVYAADTKLSALNELTTVADGDLIYIVDITDTSSKKMTVLNLFDTIDTFAELNAITADKTLVNEEDAAIWDALATFNLGITITTGDPFTLGANRIDNGSDLLDGEMIGADTIDNDSIDWGDMIDLTTDGAVSWGNIAEGELADAIVVDADIKDDVLQEPALNVTNAGDVALDNYVLSYNHAGTNFTWIAAGAGDLLADASVPMTANWDIGNYDITLKSLTGDGTIEGATITEGGQAVWNATETEIIDSDHYVDGSIDLIHLAAGVYAKDIVTTSPITGGTDNVLVGADSDVTIAVTVLKDLVTTAPVTGGTDDILTGADADVTIALDFTASWDFGGAAGFELPNAAAPTTNAAGEIALDTTITDHQPLWQYYDGGENMTVIAIDTAQLPALDNEIVKYDAALDKFILEADASAGTTAWDDIGDPDNSGLTTITFDNAETTLLTGDNDAAGSFITIQNTDADHTGGNLYLLDLDYSADDGDVDADYFKCQDSGGVVYSIRQDGDVVSQGDHTLDIVTAGQNSPTSTWLDGGNQYFTIYKANAGNTILTSNSNAIAIRPSGDQDDYLTISTASNIVTITTVASGDGDLVITAGGGDISFGDENISTSGTAATGVLTVTGVINTSVGIDAVGAVDMDYGSADVTDHTFITDGTGTAEIVLPAGSIDSTEILDATVTEVDLNVTNAPGAGEDNYVLTYNHAGTNFTWAADADTGGATAWDDIGDADAAGSIDFVTYTQTIDIGVTDDGGAKSGLILDVTGLGAGTTDVIALEITTATDDDTDYVPIAIYDDSGGENDLLFSIDSAGGLLSAGVVTASSFAGVGSSVTSVDAITGDSATAFFDAGTIEHEWGGLQADVSGYTGLVGITGADTTVEVDSKSELEVHIADVADFAEADGDTWTGTHDFSGVTTTVPWKVNTTAAPTVEGQAIWESDTDELTVGDGTASIVVAAKTNTVFCFNIHDIDSGMDDIKMPFTRATTITKVTAFVTGGTNVVGRLYEVDSDGDDADAVGVESSDWTFTAGETEDVSFNNATFDAGDYIQWDTTSVSGSVTGFMISVEGYEI